MSDTKALDELFDTVSIYKDEAWINDGVVDQAAAELEQLKAERDEMRGALEDLCNYALTGWRNEVGSMPCL
jgi:hypothetical protein